MVQVAVIFACLLLLAAFACLAFVACKSVDTRQAQDDEVAALDAIWELPPW